MILKQHVLNARTKNSVGLRINWEYVMIDWRDLQKKGEAFKEGWCMKFLCSQCPFVRYDEQNNEACSLQEVIDYCDESAAYQELENDED